MGNQIVENAIVVSASALTPNLTPKQISLFNANGTPLVPLTTANVIAHQATFAGADVTALKVELNAFRTKLLASGLMAAS